MLKCTALGMSYYSASMSWDHTRLTSSKSSKVVAQNTCSTGTATDRSEVYRYLYRYQYRYQYILIPKITQTSGEMPTVYVLYVEDASGD